MLTRIYIDNFLCFEKFEYKPAAQQLILGANGSGKSALRDVLQRIRRFVIEAQPAADVFSLSERTRWLHQAEQSFQIDAEWNGEAYQYSLTIDLSNEQDPAKRERLSINNKIVLDVGGGLVKLDAGGPALQEIPRISRTSAVGFSTPGLLSFADRFSNLACLQVNPFDMKFVATDRLPIRRDEIVDFGNWYRHWGVRLAGPDRVRSCQNDLREALNGFEMLRFREIGAGQEELVADFCRDGNKLTFALNELSDGQRCLIVLYSILHFMAVRGGTVLIDEPENFISLREIQPWLMAADDMVWKHGAQILLVSHHPELINQWAPEHGVHFVRDEAGRLGVQQFRGDPESPLSASELVARGWELD